MTSTECKVLNKIRMALLRQFGVTEQVLDAAARCESGDEKLAGYQLGCEHMLRDCRSLLRSALGLPVSSDLKYADLINEVSGMNTSYNNVREDAAYDCKRELLSAMGLSPSCTDWEGALKRVKMLDETAKSQRADLHRHYLQGLADAVPDTFELPPGSTFAGPERLDEIPPIGTAPPVFTTTPEPRELRQ